MEGFSKNATIEASGEQENMTHNCRLRPIWERNLQSAMCMCRPFAKAGYLKEWRNLKDFRNQAASAPDQVIKSPKCKFPANDSLLFENSKRI